MNEFENLLDIKQLSEFLPDHPTKQTIYRWTCNKSIPFEKHGKKIFFDKDKIIEWDNNGRN